MSEKTKDPVPQGKYVPATRGGSLVFTAHSKIADFASEYLCEELGEAGIAARAAIGIASLPGEAPAEVQIVCMVE